MRFCLILIGLILCLSQNVSSLTFISYGLSGGRLGDNLTAYMHAKWISHKYSIPLLYRPFEFSDEFLLDAFETKRLPNNFQKKFSSIVWVKNYEDIIIDTSREKKVLLMLTYYPESFLDYEWKLKTWPYLAVDWEDEAFKQLIQKYLSPKKPIPKLKPPPNKISVAVHVREGGSVDPTNSHLSYPWKFPHISFYIDQIKRLNEIFKGAPMHVRIFTDSLSPENLKRKFDKSLDAPNIEFITGPGPYQVKNPILHDFFSMCKFDCLIRPDSNFSIAAEKIGNFWLIISPNHVVYDADGNAIVDVVYTEIRSWPPQYQ